MIPITSINVASVQISTEPVSILRVRGNFRGSTADRWLMFFNVRQPLDAPNGTAPLIAATPLNQSAPFFIEESIGALEFSLGCYAAVSTTENTLTLSTDTMDITAELDDTIKPPTTTFAGDLTTAVSGLQVWSEASGATRQALVTLEVDGTNLTTANHWVMIFAKDTVNTGDVPIESYPIAYGGTNTVANGVTVISVQTGENARRFGNSGLFPYSTDSVSPFTARYGCTVKISSTPTTYTAPTGTACIRAEIRNAP